MKVSDAIVVINAESSISEADKRMLRMSVMNKNGLYPEVFSGRPNFQQMLEDVKEAGKCICFSSLHLHIQNYDYYPFPYLKLKCPPPKIRQKSDGL
jgi:hypothetical protein